MFYLPNVFLAPVVDWAHKITRFLELPQYVIDVCGFNLFFYMLSMFMQQFNAGTLNSNFYAESLKFKIIEAVCLRIWISWLLKIESIGEFTWTVYDILCEC